MRFLELVSCCVTAAGAPPRAEVTRSLVGAPQLLKPREQAESGGGLRRQKRWRLAGRETTAEWRPSLCAISEDNVVPEKNAHAEAREVERKVQRRSRSRVPSHGDDFGRAPFPSIIPAFSATPFLF